MMFFARAVVTGFGLSLGSALFKKVQKQLGLDDKAAAPDETVQQERGTEELHDPTP
ncbi:MAG TPA: hypothetical protein VK427_17025 [Kofleriaceae bacterium]|nr:hypothetical protein [Kofleriaceae bacterium]